MGKITVLDQNTINQIAAGEVVDRPSSVVKELVENAIDAKASAITVEIKEGGISFIRITDNGTGFEKDDIKVAFKRHTTSKIKTALDLASVGSLGFRGEALSSISAVAQVELITKTYDSFTGSRYSIEGGEEKGLDDIGCPEGTTIVIRNIFFNTPARRKFLKSAATEGGYISEFMSRIAICRPDISFKFINNGNMAMHTTGNGILQDAIYQVFGRDVAKALEKVNFCDNADSIKVSGFAGKAVIARGNRNLENYFINGRYIKSQIINKAIEEAYKPYIMGHKYPFTALHISIPQELIDVNVHPAKMELRFSNGEQVYNYVYHAVADALAHKNMIPEVILDEKEHEKEIKAEQQKNLSVKVPEPFEKNRKALTENKIIPKEEQKTEPKAEQRIEPKDEPRVEPKIESKVEPKAEPKDEPKAEQKFEEKTEQKNTQKNVQRIEQWPEPVLDKSLNIVKEPSGEQMTLPEDILHDKAVKNVKIVGQVFDTYWIIEYEQSMLIIDQHAAHEKVLFEKTMKRLKEENVVSQIVSPPIVLNLTLREEDGLLKNMDAFRKLGFTIEHFGGHDYTVSEVPDMLGGIDGGELIMEIIDNLVDGNMVGSINSIYEKVASLSCKAAVKGNMRLSAIEAKALIEQMLELDNPYNCPHGRPTTINMTKYELEKKFKRIV